MMNALKFIPVVVYRETEKVQFKIVKYVSTSISKSKVTGKCRSQKAPTFAFPTTPGPIE